MANFEALIRRAEGIPGAIRRRSTVIQAGFLVPEARESYIIETIATNEGTFLFMDIVDTQGVAHRLGLPPRTVQAIYQHHDSIMAQRRSARARAGAQKRKALGMVPFQKKEA